MEKKRFKRGERLDVTIDKAAFGGRGLAKLATERGEIAVFVPNTLPGQKVRCLVKKVRKNHLETALLEVLEPSPDEVEIPYQPIPGAPFARLPIALQEAYKRQTCVDLMQRIGRVDDAENLFDEFISSPAIWHYRNKMEYSFAAIRFDFDKGGDVDDFALGFKHRGTWWMVENLDADGGLFDAQVETELKRIRAYCEGTGLPPWHHPKKQGFFRFLTVRKSHANDEVLMNLVTSSEGLDRFDVDGFAAYLKSLFGERLAGVLHTVNDDIGDRVRPLQGRSRLVTGRDYVSETLRGLRFDIRMESFFQTNPRSAERLYGKAIEYLKRNGAGRGVIMDLFCGTGTIAQLVGRELTDARVVGVDIEESAIGDARRSAEMNDISNVEFHVSDVGRFLGERPEFVGTIEAVVLDPPRAGIAPKTLRKVIELGAESMVYISCNPATLARDTMELNESGYRLVEYAAVDQFPHTGHLEAVARFERKTDNR